MNEYSIKDIAELVGVSKTAIRKIIKETGIEYDRIDKNKQIFGYSKTKQIIMEIRSDFDFSDFEEIENQSENQEAQTENQKNENSQTNQEKTENQAENYKPQTENQEGKSETNSEILLLKSMLQTLQEQMSIKDKQIAAYEEQIKNKDKQIVDYSERLKEALELTKGQQYIAAAEKTAQLMDKEVIEQNEDNIITPAAEQEEKPKKSFWKRLFG